MMCKLAFFIAALLFLGSSCHGNEDAVSHLLFYDSLPDGVSPASTIPLVIRTNYSGSVLLQESGDFRVVINISAPTVEKAYSVKADLIHRRDTVLLQVYEEQASAGFVSLKWLFIGIGAATGLVFLCATIYAMCWFTSEQSMYDLAERKSYVSGSQPGIYRSRNSMQLAIQQGDMGLLAEEVDNIHNDDTLKRVPEMPEEEEAEAIEMEQMKSLKDINEDATCEQGRNEGAGLNDKNLIKSRYHSQAKTIHKDLLKKDKSKKRPAQWKTPDGNYDTVMEYPEESSEGSGGSDQEGDENFDYDTMDSCFNRDDEMQGQGRELTTFHPNIKPKSDPHELSFTNDSPRKQELKTFGKTSTALQTGSLQHGQVTDSPKTEKLLGTDIDQNYSPFLVQADVHQTRPNTGISHLPSGEKEVTLGSPSLEKNGTQNLPVKPPGRKVAFSDTVEPDAEPKSALDALELFQEVSRKYDLGQRLDVITESVAEDNHDNSSILSESGNSHSIYGSSEIFDVDCGDRVYFDINDSDLEVPPIDSDDILSDGSIPSPLPLVLSQCGKTGHKILDPKSGMWQSKPESHLANNIQGSSLNPQSKPTGPGLSTFGMWKQKPYDQGSKEIPRQSLDSGCVSSDQALYQSSASEVENSSPPLPPPPEDLYQNVSGSNSQFDFPPPPKLLQSSPQKLGEYVDLQKQPDTKQESGDVKKVGRGRGYSAGSKYLSMTLLSITCVLGIISGVYCQMVRDETKVYITMYAPKSFFTKPAVVYFNKDADGEVLHEKQVNVERFDIADPILHDLEMHHCVNHTCEQGCDENTQMCLCRTGFRLESFKECVDVNECMTGGAKCHHAAGCLNHHGSYDCICSGDYYGDGKSCQECKAPCKKGTFEVQPCSTHNQKICRDCIKVCPDGSFMLRSCGTNKNAICRACRMKCQPGEFEYMTCKGNNNMECKGNSLLIEPQTSENVILEDQHHAEDKNFIKQFVPSNFLGTTGFKFHRGKSLSVDFVVRSVQAAQLFMPVNSSGNGSFSAVPQSGFQSEMFRRYCPHPVPQYYILHYNKLKDITYYNDDEGKPQPCKTFSQFGNFPIRSSADNSFLYSEPGPMTDLFEINPEFFQTSTIWVEQSKRCEKHSEGCENCPRQCARQISTSNSQCSVIGNESDNGFSPRLRVCYTCCARKNCTNPCKDYHSKRHCQPKKCRQGSWMEFKVQPKWDSNKVDKFYCHIHPVTRQHLLDLEYIVYHNNQPFYTGGINLYGDKQWETEGKMVYRDDLLSVVVDSKLPSLPDFLEGDVSSGLGMFKVGKYRNDGPSVLSSIISGESVFIRPRHPFGMEDSNHGIGNGHDKNVLRNSLIATELEGPYQPNTSLMVVTFHNNTFPYHVTHKNAAPTFEVRMSKEVSILETVFDMATLQHKTFKGDLRHNGTHWIVDVMGRIKSCPGMVKLQVFNPDYPKQPLYQYQAAIKCPRKFHLTFVIVTGDKSDVDKDIVVSVTDSNTIHHLRIHRPGDEAEKDTFGQGHIPKGDTNHPQTASVVEASKKPSISGVVFSIPYLASVFGAIVLLLFLAGFGIALAPDVPGPESPFLRWRHMIMMIAYVTFHFMYSVIITMTVFTVVVITINSDRAEFVSHYKQHAVARSAIHFIELASMQNHLNMELSRQNVVANRTKWKCEKTLMPIIEDINKLREELLSKTEDLFEQQNIKNVLQHHSQEVLLKLSQELFSFRDNFNRYIKHLLSQLAHDVEMTYQGLENNKWLAGVRFLHGHVINIRKNLNNVSSKTFLDWSHLQRDLSKLAVDMSLALPSVPYFDGMPTPPPPTKSNSRNTRTASIYKDQIRETKIHNHWFFPFADSSSHNNQLSINLNAVSNQPEVTKKTSTKMFFIFFGLMVFVDILLFIHRMTKAIAMGRLLLFGYPEYIDYREKNEEEEGDDEVFQNNSKCSGCSEGPFILGLKNFFIQVTSTLFIPKATATVVICVLLYCTVRVSNRLFTQDTLKTLGLHHDLDIFLDLQTEMMNNRIIAHAEHINSIDYPAYQSWTTACIERHQLTLSVHHQQLEALKTAHNETYCGYLKHLGLKINCTWKGNDKKIYQVSTPGCQFSPVWPKLYTREKSVDRKMGDRQLESLLEAIRKTILNTCQIIGVFISIVVLKELFGSVLWIYIRRSGFVRLRIIFETNEDQNMRDS